ncbi:hypothetical protein [Microlunatus sp. GCM10028923]|uniref:hypothetical protein n=1 Tax=Microlunatus sp. GCM10028923 TaxID=3273400 RepID=UPI003609A8A0
MLDDNGLNPAEYIAAWNRKVESGEADKEEATAEQPRRDVDLRDSNGMTAAELRFLRNKPIDEAEAKTAEADTGDVEPRRSVVTDAQGRTGAEIRFQAAKRAEEAAKAKALAEAAADEPETANEGHDQEEGDLPDAIRAARDQPREFAEQRAAELQALLPEARRGRITMGVGVGTDTGGGARVVIGTSEDNGYLRKPLQLAAGEEIAEGRGHAETSILDHMDARDIRPSHIAAGRPICPPCADRVAAAGAEPASPLKNAKEDQ